MDAGDSAMRADVRAFLDTYADAVDRLDLDVLRECFGPTFLALDPAVCTPVPREAMLAALPGRSSRFAAAGVAGLALADAVEQPLDDRHTLVHAMWTARFRPGADAAEPLVLPTQLLLRHDGDGWRIVVYLNHTDVGEELDRRAAAAP